MIGGAEPSDVITVVSSLLIYHCCRYVIVIEVSLLPMYHYCRYIIFLHVSLLPMYRYYRCIVITDVSPIYHYYRCIIIPDDHYLPMCHYYRRISIITIVSSVPSHLTAEIFIFIPGSNLDRQPLTVYPPFRCAWWS